MHRNSFLVLLIAGLILAGCQSNPLAPGTTPATGTSASASIASNHYSMGFFNLVFDIENNSVEVIPLRSGDWHFNVTGILNSTMGVAASMVPGESDPSSGLFVLDIKLTHPFPAKPALSGFDVKGILMTPGTLPVSDVFFADLDETQLENADGFTRWWNPTEFTSPGMLGYTKGNLAVGNTALLTATANPYKLFADILGPEDSLSWVTGTPMDDPAGRAVFTAGSANSRRYRIRFPLDPGPQIIYGYAVDASWLAPSPNPPADIPDDFPIEANQPEAYRVVLSPLGNSLYYDSETATGGGVLKLQVNVHDWQGQAVGNIVPEVGDVVVNVPQLSGTDFPCTFMNATPDKARYLLYTDAIDPTAPGRTILTCLVESTDGSTYQQTGAPAPAQGLSAFQTLVLDIPDPECTADSNSSFADSVPLEFGTCASGQVCLPDDEADFFTFEIPYNHEASGEIRIFSDASGNNFTLYDSSFTDILDSTFSSGSTKFKLDDLELYPGRYYLRVRATDPSSIAVYLLDLDAELVDVSPASPDFVTPTSLFASAEYVWILGDYAYLAGGKGAFVYDVSVPSDPIYIGSTLSDAMYWDDAVFNFPYCYFIAQSGCGVDFYLGMIDFSDPTDPEIHTHIMDSPVVLDAITMDSNYLYIASWDTITATVDIYDYVADPALPAHEASFTPAAAVYCMDIAYPDSPNALLAVISQDNKLTTYTVSDLLSITLDEQVSFVGLGVSDIEIYDNYIFFVEFGSTPSDGVMLSADLDPVLHPADSLNLPGYSTHIDIQYPYAYIADGEMGVSIVDVTDPYNLTGVTSVPVKSSAVCVDAEGTLCAALPYNGGLEIFDISNPFAPVFQSKLNVINNPRTAEIVGDYLIVSDLGGGSDLVSLDISNPSFPVIVDRDENPVTAHSCSHDGNIMATSSGTAFSLWNVSDPSSPVIIGDWTPGGSSIWDCAVYGSYLYLAIVSNELEIYDINIPAVPVHIGTVPLPDMPRGIVIHEDTMYIPCDSGVTFLSLANPALPVVEGTYLSISDGRKLVCDKHWLYLAMHDGLDILDISSPLAPVLSSTLATPELDMLYLAVHGQYLFMESSSSWPAVMRVQPAGDPAFFGYVHNMDPSGADELFWIDGYLYEFTYQSQGIFIWDLY